MYGCHSKKDPVLTRLFPYTLSKLNPCFSYDNSKFGIQKGKDQTARITLFKELENVPCVYTLESSFAGLDFGEFSGKHLSTNMLESVGKDLCLSLLVHHNI